MSLVETAEGLLLTVKVTPKAKQNCIAGFENEILKIKVTAAPEKGEANRAVVILLAKTLDLPQKNIVLLRGATSRVKQFCLIGIGKSAAEHCLNVKI